MAKKITPASKKEVEKEKKISTPKKETMKVVDKKSTNVIDKKKVEKVSSKSEISKANKSTEKNITLVDKKTKETKKENKVDNKKTAEKKVKSEVSPKSKNKADKKAEEVVNIKNNKKSTSLKETNEKIKVANKEIDVETAPKRRGRPPKKEKNTEIITKESTKGIKDKNKKSEVLTLGEVNVSSEVGEIKITKKKRGRKRASEKVRMIPKMLPKRPKKPEEPKPTPPKPNVRYSDEDLAMFEKRILAVRQEALEELRMLKERLEDLTNYDFAEESMLYSVHMAEQGSEAMEKEKTYAQIQRINEYIKKLDDALQRIKDKTYGICRVCGILIAKERLLAVPITTLSASYKIQKKCPEDGIDRIIPVTNGNSGNNNE